MLILIRSDREWFQVGSILEPATLSYERLEILEQMSSLFRIVDLMNSGR